MSTTTSKATKDQYSGSSSMPNRRRNVLNRMLGQCIAAVLLALPAAGQTGTVMPAPKYTAFDNSGNPISGGKLCVYEAGTTTPATTYADASLATPNANPVVADSAGRMTVFLASGSSYKFVLRTAGSDATCSTGTVLWTQDNVLATPATTSNLDVLGTAGETVTAGQVLYLSDGSGSKTPGQWYLASTAASYSSSTPVLGVAVSGMASGAAGTVRLGGTITGLSVTAGTTYYVSATPGALSSSGTRRVGVADTTTTLLFSANPSNEMSASSITSGTLAAARATTVLTTTSTGSQNDFNPGTMTGPIVLLRCNNASLLTLTGIVAGVDGQLLFVESIGAGQVDLTPQSGSSSAANRLINLAAVGNTSLAAGSGTALYQYDATTARWRLITHDQGAWISYGGTSTFTGWSSRTTSNVYYKLSGRSLALNFYVDGTSNTTGASFTIPYTPVSGPNVVFALGRTFDNGAYLAATGAGQISSGSTTVTLFAANNPTTTWTAANHKIAAGSVVFEVQ